MASLARRLAPAAALGGLALAIVGVADPALAGHTDSTATGSALSGGEQATAAGSDSTTSQSNSGDSSSNGSAASSGSSGSGTSATDCSNGQTVSGQVAQTRWGPVQVQGTVVNGKLCEAHAVVWPSNDGRSIQINNYAIPQLDAQAAQGQQIVDGVSGATYTSQGYYSSLQSILDSL